MFGYKRLQNQIEEMRNIMLQVKAYAFSSADCIERQFKTLNDKIDHQKVEISGIKGKMTSVLEGMHITDKYMEGLTKHYKEQIKFDEKLLNKLVSDDALNTHLKEFVNKQNIIFNYIEEIEKLMKTVETVVEQQAPVKPIKLPKKTKATTAAS